MAGPPVLYYLAIDGTEAQDAATFGALLEQRGWKNLATTYLKPAADDPGRLVDPAHPFLPIPLVEARGRKIAVVAPNGRDGKGLDAFWKNYPGEAEADQDEVVRGRYAAAELGSQFMSELILTPAIHTHALQSDVLRRQFADHRFPTWSKHPPVARILYVSSHGWYSGRMYGDPLREDLSDPPTTRGEYHPYNPYFQLGAVAKSPMGFHGPEWIVFAQCSTLNSSTWPLWGRILRRSSPRIRGILAYEEAAPKAESAVHIADRFFRCLDQGASFLDAWVKANEGVKWSALVHEDARRDTLQDFPRFGDLGPIDSKGEPRYRGYLTCLGAGGEPIHDKPAPFGFKLERQKGLWLEEIVPETLGERASRFTVGDSYRLTVRAPEGSVLRKVMLTVVNLRLGLQNDQRPWKSLFSERSVPRNTKLGGFNTTTVTLLPDADAEAHSLALEVVANNPARAGLQRRHSFLWFRVGIHTDDGTLQYDFKNQGLTY